MTCMFVLWQSHTVTVVTPTDLRVCAVTESHSHGRDTHWPACLCCDRVTQSQSWHLLTCVFVLWQSHTVTVVTPSDLRVCAVTESHSHGRDSHWPACLCCDRVTQSRSWHPLTCVFVLWQESHSHGRDTHWPVCLCCDRVTRSYRGLNSSTRNRLALQTGFITWWRWNRAEYEQPMSSSCMSAKHINLQSCWTLSVGLKYWWNNCLSN